MTTYEQTAAFYANQRTRKLRELRELLRRDYGAGRYRLTKDGEVHIYGKMPNSIVTGWWLKGSRESVESEYCL